MAKLVVDAGVGEEAAAPPFGVAVQAKGGDVQRVGGGWGSTAGRVDVLSSRELTGPFAVAVTVDLLGLPSFGSLAEFPCQQVAELGMGLEDFGVNFVWVVNDKNTSASLLSDINTTMSAGNRLVMTGADAGDLNPKEPRRSRRQCGSVNISRDGGVNEHADVHTGRGDEVNGQATKEAVEEVGAGDLEWRANSPQQQVNGDPRERKDLGTIQWMPMG
ncbi:hypothetical protein E2562_018329 [Oryza meyeriana var. granulata]|uniref:Uncharacterized protein n=1 Tax=Oryza meyeriana var. granulata TaxID=110450 RepID=A0A6G1D531_9ORYZ|nr:hypothetical protein E2562_018329 [Oryza meyeriana var. granulata]